MRLAHLRGSKKTPVARTETGKRKWWANAHDIKYTYVFACWEKKLRKLNFPRSFSRLHYSLNILFALINTSNVCGLSSPIPLPPPLDNSAGIPKSRPTPSTRKIQKPGMSFAVEHLSSIQTWMTPIHHLLHSCSQAGQWMLEVCTVCPGVPQ